MHIKKDDTVVVLSGDDKGKRGKVLRVDPDKGRVLVQQINYVWKHVRRSQKHPRGGRVHREAPLGASKVQVVCPACAEPTRAKPIDREGKRLRGCRKCGAPLDK